MFTLAGGAAGSCYINLNWFSGNCLNKIFEHYTNEDPNIFVDHESGGHSDGDGEGNIVNYKYIKGLKI